eukprot:18486-Alexandrium_andersonii.AAC.1
MSASLVGSEMCIRDRCGIPWWGSMEEPICSACLDGQPWTIDQAEMPYACLLYTSDAADDM